MDSHIWEVILRFMSASFLGVKVLLLMLCCLRRLETAEGSNFEHFKLVASLLREDSFKEIANVFRDSTWGTSKILPVSCEKIPPKKCRNWSKD